MFMYVDFAEENYKLCSKTNQQIGLPLLDRFHILMD